MPLLSKGMILSRIMAFEGGKNLLLKIFNFLSDLEKKLLQITQKMKTTLHMC